MTLQNVKEKVLFICNHNSARSLMAEGLLKSLYGKFYNVYSAGADPTDVNPLAVKVMNEIGIDISKYETKNLNKFLDIKFDYVVTLCGSEESNCPFFPGTSKKIIHHDFNDPTGFEGSETDKIIVFRQIRDEIKLWIKKNFKRHV